MAFIFAIVSILSGVTTIFIDLPSALLILLTLLFFFFTTKSGTIMGKYIKTSFKKEYNYSRVELTAISTAVKNTIKFILAVGGFGFMAGLIASLAFIGSLDKLGPNLAVSLMTLTYSITTSFFVFFPIQAWAENKMNTL
jgi:flagellar motor component MotA